MKFAKELEQDLVPEWRIKYLDYKAGKKKVKIVSRAFNRTPSTPYASTTTRSDGRNPGSGAPRAASSPFTLSAIRTWSRSQLTNTDAGEAPSSVRDEPTASGTVPGQIRSHRKPIPTKSYHNERDGLTSTNNDMHYGSFGLTPPMSTPPAVGAERAQTFQLPGPAIKIPSSTTNPEDGALRGRDGDGSPTASEQQFPARQSLQRSVSAAAVPSSGDAPAPGLLHLPHAATTTLASNASPGRRLRRMFSSAFPHRSQRTPEIGMNSLATDAYRLREREFFNFMNAELDKVETFYKLKEDQAGERLQLLREQLREMRNRRALEVNDARQPKDEAAPNGLARESDGHPQESGDLGYFDHVRSKIFRPGPNSRAMSRMTQTPVMRPEEPLASDLGRDYVRRPIDTRHVPYRTAKRKLKLALQEFYRGLELLKSYALLNRTAFRKLNKKYDKAVNARPPYRFMNEKVNKAWFVNSTVLEGHIKAVEDLYAQYFERGNHKVAAGKLKSLIKKRRGDESASAFRSGALIGTGMVFAIQGLTFGVQLLFHEDEDVREEASYLLQIYGGYFLMLFLFGLFVINCYLWTENKINYPFIFEFDQRHHLDWRQLAEFPSFFLLLFGVFIWLNFSRYGSEAMFLYYPVVLIGLTLVIILLPLPILAPTSRRWFAYGHWRLLLAGLYPVEFRDFFLGDIYCSLTYAVCNISLFFCLYANHWDDPPQCNSSHSRLMGFFGALPPIWRFLQCLRRYKDTRNIFPHLVNGGKYTMSIMAAVTLSIYRIHGTHGNLALFIVFATVNGFYTSIWDLFMDFSLLQPHSRSPFLRDITALKKRWIYYAIMIADPILRFAWIFYAIFTHDRQHSTVVSFLVGFAEVFRRGIWALLRVENEHCANVAVYKASRDVPLPYRLEPLVERSSEESSPRVAAAGRRSNEAAAAQTATGSTTAMQRVGSQRVQDEEAGLAEPVSSSLGGGTALRRRKAAADSSKAERGRSFSRILAEAHTQDFVKRRKPGQEDVDGSTPAVAQSDDDMDDEEEEEDEVVVLDGDGNGDVTAPDEALHVGQVRGEGEALSRGHQSGASRS